MSSPVCQTCLMDLYRKMTEQFRPELFDDSVTTARHFLVVTFTVCVVYIECILYILYLLFTIVIFGGLWEAKNDNNKIGVWVLLLWFVTFWSSVLIERRKLGHWHFFFSIPRHDCISEFSKIKKEIPEKFIKVLKGETTIVPERRVTLNINDKLHFLNESNTTISPDKLKIKVIQGI